MNIDVRPITDAEIPEFRRAISFAFGIDAMDEEAGAEDRFRAVFELPRTVAAFDGERIVGTAAAFTFDVGVPGATVPMAGTTVVTVRPTHTRRGVLTAMMRSHLDEARSHGDAVAGLWASETAIYGRYGFGSAAESHDLSFDARTVGLRRNRSIPNVDVVDVGEAQKVIPGIYDAYRQSRPGTLSRSEPWWEHRRFRDPEQWRDGATARRYAIVYDGDDPRGYAMYRQKEKWEAGHPHGEILLIEVIALDGPSELAQWEFLGNIDLFPKVSWWNAPTDMALPWAVANPRGLQRKVTDTLWLRLLDVETALAARRYVRDGTIRIGLTDEFLPDNDAVYELSVSDGAGTCARTGAAADVTMGMPELGALYLGGRSAPTLARAGRLSGPDENVALLDEMLRWPVAPWCPEVF